MWDRGLSDLEVLVERTAFEGNWEAVVSEATNNLRRTGMRPAPVGVLHALGFKFSRLRSLAPLAAAAALAVGLYAVGALAPSAPAKCGTRVLECAAAAIGGEGSAIHARLHSVYEPDWVIEDWFDLESGAAYSKVGTDDNGSSEHWVTPSNQSFILWHGELRETGIWRVRHADPSIQFLGRYEELIAAGDAHFVGEGSFHGRRALMIDFDVDSDGDGTVEANVVTRVVVDPRTYLPIGTGFAIRGGKALPFWSGPRGGESADPPKTGPGDVTFAIDYIRRETPPSATFEPHD